MLPTRQSSGRALRLAQVAGQPRRRTVPHPTVAAQAGRSAAMELVVKLGSADLQRHGATTVDGIRRPASHSTSDAAASAETMSLSRRSPKKPG